ncbi:hypothetical protein FSOLCH5_004457 [Fusarium solani]
MALAHISRHVSPPLHLLSTQEYMVVGECRLTASLGDDSRVQVEGVLQRSTRRSATQRITGKSSAVQRRSFSTSPTRCNDSHHTSDLGRGGASHPSTTVTATHTHRPRASSSM